MEAERPAQAQRFYVGTNEHVLCLDRATGKEIWRAHPFEGGTLVTLLLAEGRIYAATRGGATCLDEASGGLVWNTKLPRLSEPVGLALDLQPWGQLFLSCAGLLFSLDASSGAVVWENGLEGLGYYHLCVRVPGAVIALPVSRIVRSGDHSHTEILEDEQQGG